MSENRAAANNLDEIARRQERDDEITIIDPRSGAATPHPLPLDPSEATIIFGATGANTEYIPMTQFSGERTDLEAQNQDAEDQPDIETADARRTRRIDQQKKLQAKWQEEDKRAGRAGPAAALLNRIFQYTNPKVPSEGIGMDELYDLYKKSGLDTFWSSAQGFGEELSAPYEENTPKYQSSIQAGARWGGYPNQLGPVPMQLLNYVVAPAIALGITAAVRKAVDETTPGGQKQVEYAALANPLLSTVAALATPYVNARLQQATVEVAEEAGERAGARMALVKKDIGKTEYLPETMKNFRKTSAGFSTGCDTFITDVKQALGSADLENLTSEELRQRVEDDGELRATLQQHLTDFEGHSEQMAQSQKDLRYGLATLRAEELGNKRRTVPVATRGSLAGASGVLVAAGLITPAAAIGVTAGVLLALQGVQSYAAGLDNADAHEFKNFMNAFFGNYRTESGEEKFKSGKGGFTEDDIDTQKLLTYSTTSTKALVKRVSNINDQAIKEVQAEIAKAPGEELLTKLDRLLADLQADKARLKAGNLEDIDPDSYAGGLLDVQGFFKMTFTKNSLLRQGIHTKRQKAGDLPGQEGQRYGSLASGGLVSQLIGRYVTGASGGASNTAPGLLGGMLGVSLLFGIYSGLTAGGGVYLKNVDRDNASHDNPVSRRRITWRTFISGYTLWYQINAAKEQASPVDTKLQGKLEQMQQATALMLKLQAALDGDEADRPLALRQTAA